MNQTVLGLYLGAFLLSMLLFHFVFSTMKRKRKLKKRLEDILSLKTEFIKDVKEKKALKQNKTHVSAIKRVGSNFNEAKFLSKWEKPLLHANSPLSIGEFFLFRLLSFFTFGFIAFVYGLHFSVIILIGLVGYWLPVLHLKNKIKKRLTRGTYQLAEALGTMANSMRAGFSFMQAMKLISEEYPDPIGTEFQKTLQDIKYGSSVEDAFAKMLERFPEKELEITVKAMLIQRTSGGNLAALLETIQETVSGRIRVKDEVRTLTAQGKMSSWIITALPICLALYLKLVNPEYFNLLTSHPLGLVMLVVGGIGIIMGWLFIRKIIQIEV